GLGHVFSFDQDVGGDEPAGADLEPIDANVRPATGQLPGHRVVPGGHVETFAGEESVHRLDPQLIPGALVLLTGISTFNLLDYAEQLQTLELDEWIEHEGGHLVRKAGVDPAGSKVG